MVKEREVKVVILGEDRGASKALGNVEKAAAKLGPSGKIAANSLDNVTLAMTQGLGPAAGPAKDALDKVGASALSSGGMLKVGLAGGALVAGAALTKFAIGGIASASSLNESLSKSNTIFGQQGAAIEKWASGGARDFGLAKGAALEAAGSFGNLFVQLDIGKKQAGEMSTTMVELAADFASFHNADITEVIQAQTAAFRGEYDAVQRFVPTINAAAVEQKALEMGLAKTKGALTAQDKAMAAYTLMVEGAGKATGDFDRTSGGLANQQRILTAEVENLQAELGQALVPVLSEVARVIIPVISGMNDLTEKVGGAGNFFKIFANTILPSLGVMGLMKDKHKEAATGADTQAQALDDLGGSSEEAKEKQRVMAEEVKKATAIAEKHAEKIDQMSGSIGAAFTTMGSKSEELSGKQRDLATSFDNSKSSADLLKQGMDMLVGVHITASRASIDWEAKIQATRAALRENGVTLDNTTEKGRNNNTAILDMVQSALNHVDALQREGASSEAVTAAYDDHVGALRNVMRQAGFTDGQINELLNRYNLLARAPDITKSVTTYYNEHHRRYYEEIRGKAPYAGAMETGGHRGAGQLNFAASGLAGFKTNGPTLVGEGNQSYPEYVLATDPKYRDRNLRLLAMAANDMGLGGMAAGGSLWSSGGGGAGVIINLSVTAGTLVGSGGMHELTEIIQSEMLKKQRRVPSLGFA